MRKLFLDCEFTGLHQGTSLMSIGLVTEDGLLGFYAELADYNPGQVDKWLMEHVLLNLELGDLRMNTPRTIHWGDMTVRQIRGFFSIVGEELGAWLQDIGPVQIVGDVLAYDWVLFCQLFGGALNLPPTVYYIPLDLATLLDANGVSADVSRAEYGGLPAEYQQHNALHDAIAQLACYRKLMKEEAP